MALKSVIATIKDGHELHIIEEKAWGNLQDFYFTTKTDELHHIIIDSQRVRYERQSEVSFRFIFEENTLHKGQVDIAQGTLNLEIYTKALSISNESISIAYQIQDNGEILSQHSITIQCISGD